MDRRGYIKARMFVQASDLASPLIKGALLEDRDLTKSLGLTITGNVTLGGNGPEFKRADLTKGVRAVVESKAARKAKIADLKGNAWTVERVKVGSINGLGLTNGKRKYRIDDLALLAGDKKRRLDILRRDATRVNLRPDIRDKWNALLKTRPLSEDELAELSECVAATPVSKQRLITERLEQGRSGTDIFVPRDRSYYEALCGAVGTQPTIAEYCSDGLGEFVASLIAWNKIEGVKQALLLGSHPAVRQLIETAPLTGREWASLMEWAVMHGDVVTRTNLIEIGLLKPEFKRATSKPLAKLLAIFTDPSSEPHDQFELFSAAFSMVYGELGLASILDRKPVYWKRLAATAQAALICRAVRSFSGQFKGLIAWMRSVRAREYALQCYIDYRTDPRWMAEFGLPNQLLNEFGGRIFHTAQALPDNAKALGLEPIIIGTESLLGKKLAQLLTIVPGPLEGNSVAIMEIPAAEIEQMRADLTVAAPVVESFSVIVSAVLMAKVPSELVELAADAISRAQYKLDKTKNTDDLGRYILALAQLAAISRNIRLADAIFVLIRNYRRNYPEELNLNEAFIAGIIACASRKDFKDWCKAIGDFITDFGFGELTKDEATGLFQLVVSLCNMVPELWASAGQGLSAMESLC